MSEHLRALSRCERVRHQMQRRGGRQSQAQADSDASEVARGIDRSPGFSGSERSRSALRNVRLARTVMAGGDGSARSWRRALTPPLSRSQLTMSCWSLYMEPFSDTLASKPTAAQELMQLRPTRGE